VEPEDALHHVRERGVADVVEQGGGDDDEALLVVDVELVRHAAREVRDTEGVGESRVLGAVIDEVREAELSDEAQSLDLGGVDQRAEDPADLALLLPRDDVVNGIAKRSGFRERRVQREHRDRFGMAATLAAAGGAP
jgi:hypothetical protein